MTGPAIYIVSTVGHVDTATGNSDPSQEWRKKMNFPGRKRNIKTECTAPAQWGTQVCSVKSSLSSAELPTTHVLTGVAAKRMRRGKEKCIGDASVMPRIVS
mmetsp:Transcript_28436/g.47255  ORF Transcript_28436/g.47255 Transcript_28436/m.47255 type:complete len:101 (-) Transcript_28436:783-1085(-)